MVSLFSDFTSFAVKRHPVEPTASELQILFLLVLPFFSAFFLFLRYLKAWRLFLCFFKKGFYLFARERKSHSCNDKLLIAILIVITVEVFFFVL